MVLTSFCAVFSIICLFTSARYRLYTTGRLYTAFLMVVVVEMSYLLLGKYSLIFYYPFMVFLITALPLSACFITTVMYGFLYFYSYGSISGFLILPVITVVSVISANINIINISVVSNAICIGVGLVSISYLVDSIVSNGLITYDGVFLASFLVLVFNHLYFNGYTVAYFRKLLHKLESIF